MKNRMKVLLGAAFGLALFASTAPAALVLSGNTAGWFQGTSSGSTVITNSVDGSSASFRTGVPISGSFKSGVAFTSSSFANIQSGDSFAFGMVRYYNGRTHVGTSSDNAVFDFYLDLSDPAMSPIKLSTITFGIDATVNDGTLVPDMFTTSFTQPAPVHIGDRWVTFTINDLPGSTQVDESTWLDLANVTVTFSPVPEPATYGLMGALALGGLVAYRRFRGGRGDDLAAGPMAAA